MAARCTAEGARTCWGQNVDVFVHKAVVSQGAVALLDLIQRREDWQRLGVLVQRVASTSAHVYLDGSLSGRAAELLHGLFGLGALVERSEYARLEDAAERILLKGGETLEVTLVSVTVAAQRHKLLSVVPASSEGLGMIQFELI